MKKRNHPTLFLALLSLLLTLSFLGTAKSQTVDWGTSYSVTPLSYTSSGSVDNQTLTWQLGWFTDGFTPDETNYLSWEANWNSVATAYHVEDGGLWAVSGHVDNVGVAAGGKQEYIFAFNDMGLLGTPTGEAFLARQDGTFFPTGPNANVFDIADFMGNTNDDSLTVVWGRVDRDMYATGGIVTGGGEFSSLVPDSNSQPPDQLNGTFEVQSGTWAPVPEPSSALLMGAMGLLIMVRRRRIA